jgi:hypothetical protein
MCRSPALNGARVYANLINPILVEGNAAIWLECTTMQDHRDGLT